MKPVIEQNGIIWRLLSEYTPMPLKDIILCRPDNEPVFARVRRDGKGFKLFKGETGYPKYFTFDQCGVNSYFAYLPSLNSDDL